MSFDNVFCARIVMECVGVFDKKLVTAVQKNDAFPQISIVLGLQETTSVGKSSASSASGKMSFSRLHSEQHPKAILNDGAALRRWDKREV